LPSGIENWSVKLSAFNARQDAAVDVDVVVDVVCHSKRQQKMWLLMPLASLLFLY